MHRTLFQRLQELTLAGQENARISATVVAEADSAFGLLEPSLADYAAAWAGRHPPGPPPVPRPWRQG
ncbi:hypothetical protein GCM10010275_36120 [Streptomyces litmocidini]|uniref:hypothetical protein n=1 Tax=Streptomyces litmocidini TaxID=67318 RepID=UPI00167C8297|nr:hypothetical protein GCM10010275_36120 [Streptomyces litmocidini]